MTVPARLKSMLRALIHREPEVVTPKHPCLLVHECVCGNPLVYSLLVPNAPDFGHKGGLKRSWTWTTVPPDVKQGVTPLFRRSPLAANEHLEFVCPVCRRKSQVQVASDGGLLPLGTMRMVYVELPPEKKEILHVEEVS